MLNYQHFCAHSIVIYKDQYLSALPRGKCVFLSPQYKVTMLLRGPSPHFLAGTTSASACNPNYLCINMPEILFSFARSERKSAASLIAIFDLSLLLKCILKTSHKCSLKVQSNFLLIRLHLKSGTEARAVPSPLIPFTFSDHAHTGE